MEDLAWEICVKIGRNVCCCICKEEGKDGEEGGGGESLNLKQS